MAAVDRTCEPVLNVHRRTGLSGTFSLVTPLKSGLPRNIGQSAASAPVDNETTDVARSLTIVLRLNTTAIKIAGNNAMWNGFFVAPGLVKKLRIRCEKVSNVQLDFPRGER